MPSASVGGSGPREVEVKLSVRDPGSVRRLLRDPDPRRLAGFESAGTLTLRRMTDRYLDTAAHGGRLAAAGHRARLRRTRHDVELTLKHEIATAGSVRERLELSGPATPSRDPGDWPPSNARSRLGEIVGREALVEIAVVRQHRLTRVLRRGGTDVEVSLDRVEALDGQRVVARRWEIEAELIAEDAGARVALEELAAALRSAPGVGDAGGPKLEFGRLHREA